MTCAYIIQSHSDPAQIQRLVRLLARPGRGAEILVVHDGRSCPLDASPLEAIPGVRVLVRSGRVVRGEISLLDPLFDGLRVLLDPDAGAPRWSWLTYLSAQDYPVRPVDAIEADLERSGRDGFMTWWGTGRGDPRNPWKPRQAEIRYLAQYRRLPDWTWGPLRAVRALGRIPPLRLHLTYGPYVGWRPRRTPFDADGPDGPGGPGGPGGGSLRLVGGTQWWSLSRPAVEHLAAFLRDREDVVRWFARTMVPDEALVQTAIVGGGAGRFDVVPDSRRYADTAGTPDGRPRPLRESDFAELTSGKWDFARKFDPTADRALLVRLDREVHGS
jgi:hypothetical protein